MKKLVMDEAVGGSFINLEINLNYSNEPTRPYEIPFIFSTLWEFLTVKGFLTVKEFSTVRGHGQRQRGPHTTIDVFAMFAPIASRRQNPCSFRTRLADELEEPPREDLGDGYARHANPLGIHVPGNPRLSPADMLFPETSHGSASTQVTGATKSGSNNPTTFSFSTVEEFSDTETVDPEQDNVNPKRRKPFASISSGARTTMAARGLKPNERCYRRAYEGDISDGWSVIPDVDISRIPTYGWSNVMKQSVQAVLLWRVGAKAGAATRKMSYD